MRTRDIPEDQWVDFLDSLTRELGPRPVTVRVSDPEMGYQLETSQTPLVGVSADPHPAGGARIEVIVGRTEASHTTHAISRPIAVRVEEDDQGAPEVLEIEGEDGSKTLVLLRPAAMGEPGPVEKAA